MELGKETCKSGRADRPATILAIATANPPNCFYQSTYPDYYFRVTKSDHMVDLKAKFKHLCEKSMIKKRYMHVTEEILEANPNIGAQMMPSLDARLDMEIEEVAKLGAEAATKAIEEWGRPKSAITHLIFHSTLGMAMPGADYQLAKLLGLEPSVKRLMLYHLGCYGGGTVLRLAKDVAENNHGARVLVVCSEVAVNAFRGPSHAHMDILVGHAIFGDGAAAAIVGANPADDHAFERPLFEIVSAEQRILPDSEGGVGGRLREVGLIYYMSKEVSSVVASNIENCLVEAFSRRSSPPPVGVNHDWISLFWIVHPGGRKILEAIQARLDLKEEKLRASREVMREYGNMMSTSVMFVLDEMRKRSAAEGSSTTGDGLEWGVLLGFGPGVTVETIVLRSVPTPRLSLSLAQSSLCS